MSDFMDTRINYSNNVYIWNKGIKYIHNNKHCCECILRS